MIHESNKMGSGCSVAPFSQVVDDIILVTNLLTKMTVDLAGSIINGHFRGLVHNNVLKCIGRDFGALQDMGSMGNGLLDIDRGDLDRIGVHDSAAVLFIRGPGNAVIAVTTQRVQLEFMEPDLLVGRFLEDYGSSRITYR